MKSGALALVATTGRGPFSKPYWFEGSSKQSRADKFREREARSHERIPVNQLVDML